MQNEHGREREGQCTEYNNFDRQEIVKKKTSSLKEPWFRDLKTVITLMPLICVCVCSHASTFNLPFIHLEVMVNIYSFLVFYALVLLHPWSLIIQLLFLSYPQKHLNANHS